MRLNWNAEINTMIIQLIKYNISIQRLLSLIYCNIITGHSVTFFIQLISVDSYQTENRLPMETIEFIPWKQYIGSLTRFLLLLWILYIEIESFQKVCLFTNHKNAIKIAENWIVFFVVEFQIWLGLVEMFFSGTISTTENQYWAIH